AMVYLTALTREFGVTLPLEYQPNISPIFYPIKPAGFFWRTGMRTKMIWLAVFPSATPPGKLFLILPWMT
ncbi:MAG: hypothetical protein Q8O74_09770, partial [bacterium]|nr:hypothetical protein [bacterium]